MRTGFGCAFLTMLKNSTPVVFGMRWSAMMMWMSLSLRIFIPSATVFRCIDLIMPSEAGLESQEVIRFIIDVKDTDLWFH
jgi:hypothetical protein